jgi:23S rRNA pseudouridine2605 synthase
MRLARFLAHSGVASRREAERIVAAGRVLVDGERALDPALDVGDDNVVAVDGRRVRPEPHEHYALHKPVGVVSTARDPQGRPKVTDLVPSAARLYPVGRLDADSSGLILLTNDGDLANALTHPRFEVVKRYRVRVAGDVREPALDRLRAGVELEDGVTAPAGAEVVERGRGETAIEVQVHEGRKRQVRRMCEAVGHPVIALERVRFGRLELGGLRPGEWRKLNSEEVAALRGAGRSGA